MSFSGKRSVRAVSRGTRGKNWENTFDQVTISLLCSDTDSRVYRKQSVQTVLGDTIFKKPKIETIICAFVHRKGHFYSMKKSGWKSHKIPVGYHVTQ